MVRPLIVLGTEGGAHALLFSESSTINLTDCSATWITYEPVSVSDGRHTVHDGLCGTVHRTLSAFQRTRAPGPDVPGHTGRPVIGSFLLMCGLRRRPKSLSGPSTGSVYAAVPNLTHDPMWPVMGIIVSASEPPTPFDDLNIAPQNPTELNAREEYTSRAVLRTERARLIHRNCFRRNARG